MKNVKVHYWQGSSDNTVAVDKFTYAKLCETSAEGNIETALVHIENLQELVSALVQILVDKDIMEVDDLNRLIRSITYTKVLEIVEEEEANDEVDC